MRHGNLLTLLAQNVSQQAKDEVGNFVVIIVMGAMVVLPTVFLALLVVFNRRGGSGEDEAE